MPIKKAKRADGRYAAYLSLGTDGHGKRLRKVFYGETQKEAQAKLRAYRDGLTISRDASKMTLEKWSRCWLESYASGGIRNRENNQSIVNVFLRGMGRKACRPISEILPADIQVYARAQSSHTKAHVSKVRRAIEAIFRTAKENGYVVDSPCRGIVWDAQRTGTHQAVGNDISRLITENWQLHTAGIWAMLILYAGLRPSEAFALQREQIDGGVIHVRDGSHFEHGQLVVTKDTPKSDAGRRDIPILPPLEPVVAAMPDSGFVCLSTSGKPVSQSACKRNWTAFIHLLELVQNGKEANPAIWQFAKDEPGWQSLSVSMYDLRHSYCSMLYDAGVDVKTAQYLMGHSDLEVTLKIYTHLSEQKKQHSYDALFAYCERNGSQSGSQDTSGSPSPWEF